MLCLFLMFLPLFANAQFIGFKYIDTNLVLVERTVDAIHNPDSAISLIFTAGLNRTITYSIYLNGALVDSETSTVITVRDRLSYQGSDYYGKAFTTNTVTSDALYTVNYTVNDHLGVSISTGQHHFSVDKTPPSFGQMWATGSYGMAAGYSDVYKLGSGGSGAGYILLYDVDDNVSIGDIRYNLYHENGSLVRNSSVSYNQTDGYGKLYFQSIFPKSDLDEAFRLEFIVKDTAGNVAVTPRKTIYYDNSYITPTVFGVYDPNSNNVLGPGLTGYVPYVPGMAVKTNPIKLAYKIPKTSWSPYSEGGLRFTNALGPTSAISTDSNYIYFTTQLPYGNTNGNYVRFINFGQWGGPGVSYSLVLDVAAPKTPYRTGVEYLTDKLGWIPANSVKLLPNSILPVNITKAKISVQARSFVQQATHGTTCVIPAGGLSCTVDFITTLAKGNTGYLHGNFAVTSVGVSSPELAANATWAEISYNDKHYPIISDVNIDTSTRHLTAIINQPGAGSYFNRLRLNSVWLEYKGVRLNPLSLISQGVYNEVTFDITQLPAGNDKLIMYALENHGPKTSLDLGLFNSDKTPPVISLSDNGELSFTEIVGLENLLVTVDDDSPVTINYITLTGGPADDTINMASIKQSTTDYSLEYPRIFPALIAEEQYSITIKATDDFLNTTTITRSFTYRPLDLVELGDIRTYPVNKILYLLDNSPISTITTEVLRGENGALATGVQTIYVTLRSDAHFPIVVEGVTISAGETKEITFNINKYNGRLNIPVYPSVSGVSGTSNFMVTMPVIEFEG